MSGEALSGQGHSGRGCLQTGHASFKEPSEGAGQCCALVQTTEGRTGRLLASLAQTTLAAPLVLTGDMRVVVDGQREPRGGAYLGRVWWSRQSGQQRWRAAWSGSWLEFCFWLECGSAEDVRLAVVVAACGDGDGYGDGMGVKESTRRRRKLQ